MRTARFASKNRRAYVVLFLDPKALLLKARKEGDYLIPRQVRTPQFPKPFNHLREPRALRITCWHFAFLDRPNAPHKPRRQ